ncbi:uncharacterized protein VTP21DRAFT_8627 [Calcarisporiella thermophila]|uniref:uncharacterized protein n=1 Tax=Calcarisporiella thermophila TaxID=911321 RepID=UPI003742FCBD
MARLAEHFHNINTINVSIGLSNSSSDALPTEITIHPHLIAIRTQSGSEEILPLPARIDPKRVTRSSSGTTLNLKLPTADIRNKFKDSSNSGLELPISSREILDLQSIACQFCQATLTKPAEERNEAGRRVLFKKVKDLPSEHWLELVDCWMCHEDQDFKVGEIKALPRVGLVGGTYLLLHPTDVNIEAVELTERKTSLLPGRYWRPLTCQRCLSPLGEALFECSALEENLEQASEPKLVTLKFNKYFIQIDVVDSSRDCELVSFRPSFKPFIAHDFLEAARAHATYRFIIEGQETKKPYLTIWIFNPFIHIMATAAGSIVEATSGLSSYIANDFLSSSSRYRKVMKILYTDCTDRQDEKVKKILKQFSGDKQVERFYYNDDLCKRILLMLRLSTQYLPPDGRVINGFQVGFLDY